MVVRLKPGAGNPSLLKLANYRGFNANPVVIPVYVPPAPPAPTGDLLDDLAALGVTPAYAWSITKIKSTYNGPAVKIRRASDNAEQDINFLSNRTLDASTLASFCGSSIGYVTTWYDQSGNARHATQTSQAQQPILWSGTAINTINGAPGLLFDGSDDGLTFPNTGAVTGNNALTLAVWAGGNNTANTAGSILNQSSVATRSSAYIWVSQSAATVELRTFGDNLSLGGGSFVVGDRNAFIWRYDPTPNPTYGTLSGHVLYRQGQNDTLNGEIFDTHALGGAMVLSASVLAIGRRSTTSDRFNGTVMAALYIPAALASWPSVKTVLQQYWT
ncbi:MAG: arabinofuranosidase catalytic domain-containing protein [Vampirovibrionales bacterium]|nr:arabinofuranosidase catalytic domain-containing protein [Vampirovibrionales bacterium]